MQLRRANISTGDYTVYEWDHRNRLVAVSEYDDTDDLLQRVENRYDAFNRWVGKTVDEDGDATVDRSKAYVYDENQIVLRFADDDAAALAASDLTNRYLWGPAVDQLLADEQVTSLGSAGDVLWAAADHQNTIRDWLEYNSGTNTTTVADHRQYDSFGNLLSAPVVDVLFGYTGRALDEDTGLQNNLHRWYEARTGRWMSEDPIGFNGGDTNLLRYVANNPVLFVDFTGLWRQPVQTPNDQDTWIAENNDTFAGLVQKLRPPAGRRLNPNIDQYAIRPIEPSMITILPVGFDWDNNDVDVNKMKAAWENGKPIECGWYDTSYLTHNHAKGRDVKVTVGNPAIPPDNGYLSAATRFFGTMNVMNGAGVLDALANASRFGQTPVETVWIVGHGGNQQIGSRDGDLRWQLSVNDLKTVTAFPKGKNFYGFPKWDDAIAGRLSTGFWFDHSAQVYLIGCITQPMARNLATQGLRTTAAAFGTTKLTWAFEGGMGWGDSTSAGGPRGKLEWGISTTPNQYFQTRYWNKNNGAK